MIIIQWLLRALSFLIRNFIPKRDNLIIMQSNSLQRYSENSRFLYEYLHEKDDLEVYWDTNNKDIYEYLTSRGYNVLWHYSIKSYIIYVRAKIVIGTGSYYPDFFKAVGSKTIKYCLFHGSGPKVTTNKYDTMAKTLIEPRLYNRYDFFNTTSVFDLVMKGLNSLLLPSYKLVINGYPRCDHLFDKEKNEQAYNQRTISRGYFPYLKDQDKVLLYAPTFRHYDFGIFFPMNMYKDYSEETLEKFLSDNNIFLLVSMHPHMKREGTTVKESRIRFIDTERDPFFEITLLLPEIDILLGDYSTVHTDFAILDRPQIYVMPDYDEYFRRKGFIEDFKQNLCGEEAMSFKHLQEIILKYIENPCLDKDLRKRLLEKYYDTNIKNSCEKHYKFFKESLLKT